MKRFCLLYRVELHRLCLSKVMWLFFILCIASMLLGYKIYTPCGIELAMTNEYIANPVLAGTSVGAILFAILTIWEMDKVNRNHTDALTDSIASLLSLSIAKISSILTVAIITTGIASLVYFPFTSLKMEYLFTPKFYFLNFFVFMFPTWWISILVSDAFYRITKRVELSILLYVFFAYFSFSTFSEDDYFFRWLNPLIPTYSDGFISYWPLRVGIYTRLLWFFLILGFWFLSLLCTRKYEKGLFACFLLGIKKVYLSVFAIAFLFAGSFLWIYQPFVDHGPEEFDHDYLYLYDDVEQLDVTSVHYDLKMDTVMGTLSGRAEYKLQFPFSGENMLKLNPGYKVTKITYDEKEIAYKTYSDDVNGQRSTVFKLLNTYGRTLVIEYSGFPAMERYCYPDSVFNSIDPDYISLRSSCCVVPTLIQYNTYTEKTTLEITIPQDLILFLDHVQMQDFIQNKDGTRTWKKSCPIIVPDIKAGRYKIDSFLASGVTIDFVYGEIYQEAVENYDIHQAVKDVFAYCSKHYGESAYASGKRLMLFQNSAFFFGGWAREGSCDWYESYLSPKTLYDKNKGVDAKETFIHEMIHQWWGAFGLDFYEDDTIPKNENLWSSEGMTVYSSYRLIKEMYGELYAKKYYVDEWKKDVDRQNRSFYNRRKEYIKMLPKKYQARINTSNFEINLYNRMPLMILKAEELVGGEEKMDNILSKMYADRNQYKETGFSYQDFLMYCGLKEEDLYLE